jgi:hypothetical protein
MNQRDSKEVGASDPHLQIGSDPISNTFCFLVVRIPEDGPSPQV